MDITQVQIKLQGIAAKRDLFKVELSKYWILLEKEKQAKQVLDNQLCDRLVELSQVHKDLSSSITAQVQLQYDLN